MTIPEDKLKQAYELGRFAKRSGLPAQPCPYTSFSEQWAAWLDGWKSEQFQTDLAALAGIESQHTFTQKELVENRVWNNALDTVIFLLKEHAKVALDSSSSPGVVSKIMLNIAERVDKLKRPLGWEIKDGEFYYKYFDEKT